MKNKIICVLMFLVSFMFINQVDADYYYNGAVGGKGPGAGSECNSYNGFCLFNTKNNVGLRLTLMYCDSSNNCKSVSTLNAGGINHNFHSIDVWKKELYAKVGDIYYGGKNKTEASAYVSKGNYSYHTNVLPTNLFALSTDDTYYSVYKDLVPLADVNKILLLMSGGTAQSLVLTEASLKSEYKHLSSKQCTTSECYGFRIFLEPLFTWKRSKGTQDYVLTPTELAHIATTPEMMAGDQYHRLWTQAVSLTTIRKDVGISVPDTSTNATWNKVAYNTGVRTNLLNKKIGYGLNIMDPEFDRKEVNCKLIEDFNPGLNDKSYDELSRLGNLIYTADKKTVSSIWYRDNCSCGILYNYYSNKNSGNSLFNLTKNGIKILFDSKYFDGVVQTPIAGFPNEKWTMTKYLERGCKYKDDVVGEKTCDDVISFYKGLGQDLPSMNKNEISKINFNLFNRANRTTTPWSATRYFEEGCPYNKKDCTPKYSLFEKGGVGTCYTGEIKFNDSENWEECIFTNAENDITNTTTNYKDDSLSNNYCEIYCREDLKTNFSNEIKIVKAGERFTWDQHYLLGSRTCKTKNVNWTKFDSDLKSTNQKILDEYAEYKLEEKLANVTWKRSSAPDCDWSCDSWYPEYSCPTEKDPGRTCGGGCRSGSDKDYNYTPSSTYEQFSVSGNGLRSSKSQSLSTTCGGPGYTANSETIATARNEYTNAVSSANSIVKTMNACYDTAIWDSKIYNMDPKVSVSYGDNTYSYVGKMLKTITYDKLKYNLNCKAQNVYKMTGCSGSSCSGENVGMQNCISVEMSKSGTASFKIPGDVFKYIIKDTHLSIHGDGVKDYIDSMSGIKTFKDYAAEYAGKKISFNYIDLIYGNFPVAFSTPVGIYGGISGNGDLSLKFFDLGHKIENQQTKIDSLLSIADSNTIYGEYKCDFKVIDGLIPEKSSKGDGIDVIYRPIDLDNPFPDIDGSGRVQGSNWCDTEDCSMNSSHVVDYITNNRGVKTYEIYNQEPMYTFTLTPSLLKKIRQYNKQNSYAEYYGIDDEKAYDFVCSGNSKCISEYLTNLIQLTGATGSCTTNRKDNFDACRFR